MSKQAKILSEIDPRTQKGLEIGALCRPIVTRDMGDIRYVDHDTTGGLRKKYAGDPDVNTDEIVTVDYLWGDQPLCEVVGSDLRFDYVIGSHVAEHVPDLIGWLQEVAEVIRPGGKLSLVIPDRRFTFDYRRSPSTRGDVIDAHLRRLRTPTAKSIFDHMASIVEVDPTIAWSGTIEHAKLRRIHSDAAALATCREVLETGRYRDCHCWVFTPESFIDIVRTLISVGLFDYRISRFFPTATNEIEFFVTLERLDMSTDPEHRQTQQLASLPDLTDSARPSNSLRYYLVWWTLTIRKWLGKAASKLKP